MAVQQLQAGDANGYDASVDQISGENQKLSNVAKTAMPIYFNLQNGDASSAQNPADQVVSQVYNGDTAGTVMEGTGQVIGGQELQSNMGAYVDATAAM
jgi:hypothetical protein